MTDDIHNGVAIAGAGPVGLTAAVSLASKGIPVRVYERGEQLSTESRASTFHPSSLELLEELGVVDTLLKHGLRVPAFQFRDRAGGMIARLEYSVLADDTPFPFRIQFEQSKLTPVLLDRLRSFGHAEVRFGCEIVTAADANGGVALEVRHRGGTETLRSTYAIGADGAGSLVRKSLGLDFAGLTYPERYLVVSTSFEFQDALEDISYVNYISDPKEWFALLRTPDHWRATFPLGDEADDVKEQEADRLERRLQGIYEMDDRYPIVHTNIYRVHRRVAETFAKGRIALAGDAAHVNNPLGGLGMNSGILDAFFLSEHLERALQSTDGEEILAEYGERHRHVALNVVGAQSNYNWVALRESEPEARIKQQQELRDLAADPVETHAYLMNASLLNALRDLQSVSHGPGR